ncbi:MAG: hypothetical protein AAGJ82_04280 [Bacteroidota bacterium]
MAEQVVCAANGTPNIFLNEIFPCSEGGICEAQWAGANAASSAIYNECEVSIETSSAPPGCYTFIRSSDGQGLKQCGAFTQTFNVEIVNVPEVMVSGDQTIDCGEAATNLTATTSGTILRWERNTNPCAASAGWVTIPGTNGMATYHPGSPTQTTYYRVVSSGTGAGDGNSCTGGGCELASDCVTVTTPDDCPTCVHPAVQAFALQSSCTDGIPNDDAYLQLSTTTGDRVAWSPGATFSGNPDYTDADVIGGFPFVVANGLANPIGQASYTLRVFNGDTDCFADVTVTLEEQLCVFSCECVDYVYVNDPLLDLTHKFAIDPATGG